MISQLFLALGSKHCLWNGNKGNFLSQKVKVKRCVRLWIVQRYGHSKKSLIHRHPESIFRVDFSGYDDVTFCKNTSEREKFTKEIIIFVLTLLKFLVFPSAWGEVVWGKRERAGIFWSMSFAFLVRLWPHFGLWDSDMYSGKLHIFTYGKKTFNDGLHCSL